MPQGQLLASVGFVNYLQLISRVNQVAALLQYADSLVNLKL